MLHTWMSIFFSWAYSQTNWFLSDIQWFLTLVIGAPFNLLLVTIFLIATAYEEGDYYEILLSLAGVHMTGLFIYVIFLGSNLKFYRINQHGGPVEYWL